MSDDQTGTPPEAPALTVPLNADGSVKELPEALQKHLDGIVSRRLKEDRERRSRTPDPVETERLKTLEQEVEQYRLKDAEGQKNYEEALRIREQREQAERQKLQAEVEKRTKKIQRGIQAEIQAAALKAGARDESLDELAALLGPQVALNDDLDPVVVGEDGQPVEDGIAGLVARYLERRPHHRRGPAGESIGAAGGAFRQTGQTSSATARIAEIQARVQQRGGATGQDLQDLREARASAS